MKKDKMQLDILPMNANKYYPQEDDTVIAIVKAGNPEFFTVEINADATAILPCLEHQNATKKDKPRYAEGTLVYCRVLAVDQYARTTLSCINPLDKKAWNSGEAFFQDLKGGMMKDYPIAYCRHSLLSQDADYLL